jgi:hypothetical protein
MPTNYTLYPAQIDTALNLPPVVDMFTPVQGAVTNGLRSAILSIEATLGVQPNGPYSTVAGRLTTLENTLGNLQIIQLSQDLGGTIAAPKVVGIQGRPVSSAQPSIGQLIGWNGIAWVPTTPSGGGGSFTPGGDLAGTSTSQLVIGLYGNPLSNTIPVNSAVPVWDSTVYDIRQLTQDDILPGFSITGFGGGSVVECGATVTNPSFSASYSSLPSSANIANTDAIDSPLTLTTPFTSGTVVGSFHHTAVNDSVTFTLTAIKGVTRTATTAITYEARSFGGVGGAGATSATALGSTAVLSASLGTLSDEGLHGSDVGQSYGPFNPTSQKIYLLMPHTSPGHTFKDQNGFTFAMNSPTTFSFTNQNAAVISMDLYESTNLLSTTFTITVET